MNRFVPLPRYIAMFPIVGAIFYAGMITAAPMKMQASLPLTGEDIANAQATLHTNESTEQFTYFIKGLEVYPDHQNPTAIDQIENRTVKKAYYVAPFFQASEERSVVGGQEIASEGIKIIAEVYDLVSAFDYELFKINQLLQEKKKKNETLEKLRTNLSRLTDPLAIANTQQLITQVEGEIASLQTKITDLENQAERGINETSNSIKRQVVGQVQLKLSFLGVTATSDESTKLNSNVGNQLREGIASLIARATSQGQYGYRTAVFEAGYTRQQKNWIALYRQIRPDVQVSSLATNVVYARSTALTSKTDTVDPFSYFLGGAQVVNAPRLFLAINGGSHGKCGNTRSCNVTIEYTWLGATMAKTSRSGAVSMPVYFEADVKFKQPDFEGSVSCDFTNGFKVQGRADVKDGAIIYDGDVYNKINYSAIEEGACSYQIVKGDANSAAYYTIKSLYENYMNLKMQRAAKSRSEMDRYREYVNSELNYHATRSQQNSNYDFWSLTTWTSAFGGLWGTVASFVVGSARNFYWHTRIEDSTTTESVKFTTSIKEENIEKDERIAFDGFTMLCWIKDGTDSVLAACPAANVVDYQRSSDTDLGKNQQLCGENGVSADCVDRAQENETNSHVDEHGVIEDPWA